MGLNITENFKDEETKAMLKNRTLVVTTILVSNYGISFIVLLKSFMQERFLHENQYGSRCVFEKLYFTYSIIYSNLFGTSLKKVQLQL